MTRVYILHHMADHVAGEEAVKIVGAYSSQANAAAAIERMKDKPGFIDHPDGFSVDEYQLDRDYWAEGFVSEG